jgi:hypothetical protein
MSIWYEPTAKDIDLSDDGEEIDILFDQDNFGNKYITIKTKDIEKLLRSKNDKTTKNSSC